MHLGQLPAGVCRLATAVSGASGVALLDEAEDVALLAPADVAAGKWACLVLDVPGQNALSRPARAAELCTPDAGQSAA